MFMSPRSSSSILICANLSRDLAALGEKDTRGAGFGFVGDGVEVSCYDLVSFMLFMGACAMGFAANKVIIPKK